MFTNIQHHGWQQKFSVWPYKTLGIETVSDIGLQVQISRQNKPDKVYIMLQENFTLVLNNFGNGTIACGCKCVYPDVACCKRILIWPYTIL